MPKNPYGGGPGTGIALPPYYRSTPSIKSRNNFFPLSEELGPDEMRISFFPYDEDLVSEALAAIRAHWDGLFLWGAPNGVVANVTKDAIWSRQAVIPDTTGQNPPPFAKLAGDPLPREFVVPQPRTPREVQQDRYTRDIEIDPKKYLPEDMYRDALVKLWTRWCSICKQ
jgi:hypothetical protein